MLSKTFASFDCSRVPSPCYVVDEVALEENLKVLQRVQQESGAKVLAALKAFSMWSVAPLVSRYLSGTCSSGLHEALLAKEYYAGEVHVYSAAYKADELSHLTEFADHIVLNSFSQWQRFSRELLAAKAKRAELSIGLRINPEHSEGDVALYDPCAPCSRLGIPFSQFDSRALDGIDGLHFHNLCEHGVEPLKRTLAAIECNYANVLPQMRWVNFGGGHLITSPDYDVDELIRVIKAFSQKYAVQVYLEPGEAVAIRSGVLVAEVLDLSVNQRDLAILDTSATCHMPDTLEMPYRADVYSFNQHTTQADRNPSQLAMLAGTEGEHAHSYRLGGMTCLAGDVIGDYSFEQPLFIGQRLMFDDMAHYTMVKTTTFNGIPLPAIAIWNSSTDSVQVVKQFGYEDFKSRLS